MKAGPLRLVVVSDKEGYGEGEIINLGFVMDRIHHFEPE